MTPTPAAAALLAGAAILALFLPGPVALLAAAVAAAAVVADAWAVRRPPPVVRESPGLVSRGVPARITVEAAHPRARVRQPAPPDLRVTPDESSGTLHAELVAVRRGRHQLPAPAVRVSGSLGLGAWTHSRCGEPSPVLVYPDIPAARTLATAVRQGRFREPGRLPRGPLGLGTELESVRDYQPDDDIRQLNVRATARLGRPMANQYRIEQDRAVMCVLDMGRLMGAPISGAAGSTPLTRLDVAVDAATAVAFVADAVGDRCGVLAFDDQVRRHLRPRRAGGDSVVRAIFDLEPSTSDSDYELAFRTVAGGKRTFVLVVTDLLEESAARPLVEAVPVLARRHAVAVVSATDPDLEAIASTPPADERAALEQSVAVDVLAARARAAHQLRRAGAVVVEAGPRELPTACVGAYLRAKARARA